MASTPTLLGQLSAAATTREELYVVPGSTNTTISSIFVANRSSTATTFRIGIADAGAAVNNKEYLYYDVAIPGNDTFVATTGITLEATDKIYVYAGAATLTFNVFGVEIT